MLYLCNRFFVSLGIVMIMLYVCWHGINLCTDMDPYLIIMTSLLFIQLLQKSWLIASWLDTTSNVEYVKGIWYVRTFTIDTNRELRMSLIPFVVVNNEIGHCLFLFSMMWLTFCDPIRIILGHVCAWVIGGGGCRQVVVALQFARLTIEFVRRRFCFIVSCFLGWCGICKRQKKIRRTRMVIKYYKHATFNVALFAHLKLLLPIQSTLPPIADAEKCHRLVGAVIEHDQ
jgi:hypothetical protein